MRNIIIFFLGLSMLASTGHAQTLQKSFSFNPPASITSPVNNWSAGALANPDSHGCKIDQATANAFQSANAEQRAAMTAAMQTLEGATALSNNSTNNNSISAAAPLHITIPTVVHVVHNNGPELIGEYQITDAIDQLNEDMAALPYVSDGFGYLQADVGYTFELAKLDPYGNPTNGITYTVSNTTYDGTEGPLQSTINWPRHKYLNIWVVNSSDGTGSGSAYSNYPSTVANGTGREFWDGIVVSYWAMGRTGSAISTHYKILTHEVGHWANLKHTWGDQTEYGSDAACNDDDGVSDTPNTKGNGGCGPYASCGSQDNEQNFMDYGSCSTMFTLGQADRMHAAMQSSVADRNNLWTTANLVATGLITGNQPPTANANGPYYGTPSSAINFSSSGSNEPGGNISSYSWNFGDGSTSNQANPSHSYASLGTYNVTLTVTDDDGQTDSDTTTATILEAGSFITAESEPNNSAAQANGNVGPVAPVSGTISSASDTDWFFFEVSGSGSINVRLDILGNYADLDMWVYHESDLNNEVLEGYTDDPNMPYEEGSFNATQNGIYFVHVDGWETETSDYTLKVTGSNIVGGGGSSSGGSSSGGSSSGGSSSGGSSSGGSSSGGSSGGNQLQNGVPVSGLSASTGNDVVYSINVPSGASNLVIKIEGGSGDADLYTRAGAVPTDSTYDCRPYIGGNNETCTEASPSATTWYARVKAYQTFSNVTLTASFTTGSSSSGGSSSGGSSSGGSSSGGSSSGGSSSGGSSSGGSSSGGNQLQNGVPVSGLSASTGNDVVYSINVPSGASNLVIKIEGGSGDADLYTRAGAAPTDSTYDCRPYIGGNNETCTEASPSATTWYARVKAYQTFSNVTLTASYTN